MFQLPSSMLKKIVPALVTAGTLLLSASGAGAADAVVVPKVIKIIVPYAPGASTDLLARQLGNALAKRLGNTVIVDNKPGGGSMLGSAFVAKAPPDGATLLLTSSAFTIAPAIYDKPLYDPVNDFAPVAMLSQLPMILAVPASSPYKTPADFVSAARSQPGVLNYGSSGIGSSNHMAMELFKGAANLKITHVPYKGMAPAALDLSTGQLQAIIGTYSSLAAVLQSGKVRALAVSSLNPSPLSPDLPALSSTVPGFGMSGWFAVFAPRGTPQALVELLNKEVRASITTEEFTRYFAQERTSASDMDVPTLASLIKVETGQWKKIAADQHIQAE